jgi:hypothetical protein
MQVGPVNTYTHGLVCLAPNVKSNALLAYEGIERYLRPIGFISGS